MTGTTRICSTNPLTAACAPSTSCRAPSATAVACAQMTNACVPRTGACPVRRSWPPLGPTGPWTTNGCEATCPSRATALCANNSVARSPNCATSGRNRDLTESFREQCIATVVWGSRSLYLTGIGLILL